MRRHRLPEYDPTGVRDRILAHRLRCAIDDAEYPGGDRRDGRERAARYAAAALAGILDYPAPELRAELLNFLDAASTGFDRWRS